MAIQNDKKIIRAWTFYDWANSSFPLVINSAVFPAFYEYQTTQRDPVTQAIINDTVTVGGHVFKNTELYSYFVSLALLVVCFTAPILSGIADYKGNKKRFLAQFCVLGSFSCAGMYFFDKGNIALSMIPFVIATIGYWGSLVFYNAYLPEIATTDQQDKVSARGFALGYLGSSLLLIINLVLITLGKKAEIAAAVPSIPELAKGDPHANWYPARYAFVSVAIWWFAFAQYTLKYLPKGEPSTKESEGNVLTKGFRELKKVLHELKEQIALKRFLRSYFFYNMGVQTVMYMATLFAAKEIDWPDENYKKTALIISILLIQFLGVAGSFLFSWMSSKMGNIKALLVAIFIWILICVNVFMFVKSPLQFYCVAAAVGLVMGGIQALSRSTYSKLLPETMDHASYFSFFDVSEKLGIVLGVFAFGFIEGLTGSMRSSVLVLISFFALGFLLLLLVPKEKFELKD
ncbi:MAG: MFS transporter [Bacteroidia bacterium]